MEPQRNPEGPNAQTRNPWRTGVLTAAVLAGVFAIAGGVLAGLRHVSEQRAARAAAEQSAREAEASRAAAQARAEERARRAEERSRAIANCNRYAADMTRDNGHIVKNGAIGGAIGAGVGAAGGAILDGGKGAGKGAGLGALLGATAGAFEGLSEENKKNEQARAAYADCMARAGN